MDEASIIERLRNGEPSAFHELVESFRDRVFNTSIGLLQQREDAEDITQEVFVEIYRSVAGFRGESKLSTWIYRITVQKSMEFLRWKARKKRSGIILQLFGKEGKEVHPGLVHFDHPGTRLENKERSAILFQAISKLPLNQRTAFTLHKVEGLSYAEISGIIGVSLSSVESLMFRAKQNLQQLLSHYYDKNEK
ncbi:MAG: RNA polymerase sigma factor [Bacteroidetes bacterium]|nr:RNA polymerase sigma factor [Bacteroidota bacterium]